MAKYRKKTLTEFVLYEKGMEDGFLCTITSADDWSCGDFCCDTCEHLVPIIQTIEGKMIISLGDYIRIGIQGERYPIKPDILAATYEKVEE